MLNSITSNMKVLGLCDTWKLLSFHEEERGWEKDTFSSTRAIAEREDAPRGRP